MQLGRLFVFSLFISVGFVSAQTPSPLEVSVLSYNIRHGAKDNGQTNLLRVVELIKKYKPDLVALQDIDSGAVRSGKLNQLRILALLTGYEETFAKGANLKIGVSGVGILSRWPIEAVQKIMLPNPSATQEQVLCCALIELPNFQFLRFCSTQLEKQSSLARAMQLGLIQKFFENSVQPVVLAGSLNADPTDPHLLDLLSVFDDSGRGSDEVTFTDLDGRFDYVLTQKKASFECVSHQIIEETGTSDHLPVLVKYRLR